MATLHPPKVYFADGSSSRYPVNETDTVASLYEKVCNKLGLEDSHRRWFAMFEISPDYIRWLSPEALVSEVRAGWGEEEAEEDPHAPWETKTRFEVRKWTFNRPRETLVSDPKAVHLFWIQAVYEVSRGIFPATEEQVVALGGLHCHAVFGDHISDRHTDGFLIPKLPEYVPAALMGNKTPEEWEASILQEHAKYEGVAELDAKKLFLEKVRSVRWYGTIFFPPAPCVQCDGEVKLGIGPDGVCLLNPGGDLMISFPHTKVRRWVSSQGLFGFEVGRGADILQFSLESSEHDLMDKCMELCVAEILEAMEEREAMKRREEEAALAAARAAAGGKKKDKKKKKKAKAAAVDEEAQLAAYAAEQGWTPEQLAKAIKKAKKAKKKAAAMQLMEAQARSLAAEGSSGKDKKKKKKKKAAQ